MLHGLQGDGVQLFVLYSPNNDGHNHPEPAVHKFNKCEDAAIVDAIKNGHPIADVEAGICLSFIPVDKNKNYANGTNIAHLARVAHQHKSTGFQDSVEDALYIVAKAARRSTIKGTNWYTHMSSAGHPILMSPAQLQTFRQSRVLEVDTTYTDFSSKARTAPDARPYLTNVVAYWEAMQKWVVVARLWTNSLGAPVVKDCFVFVFTLAKKGNEAWKLSYIETIVIDFSRALFQAL